MAKKTSKKATLEQRAHRAPSEEAIDTILSTMWATHARGYTMVEPKTFRSAARKKIGEHLASIDEKAQPAVSDRTTYRLEQLEEFTGLTKKERESIIEVAKNQHVSLEEAYTIFRELEKK